jgi:hypothetical protein
VPTIHRKIGALLLGVLLSACGEGTLLPLCPTCRPSVGGQTGDFGGTSATTVMPCPYLERELTPELRQMFGLAELTATLAQFTNQLEWYKEWVQGVPVPAGKTTIDVSVTLGGFTYRETQSGGCHNAVLAPVTATWATRDGTLAAETRGQLVLDTSDLSWKIDAKSSLSEAKGTLKIPIDTKRIVVGTLLSTIYPLPTGGLGGSVEVSLLYFDDQASFEKYQNHMPASDTGIGGVSYFTPVRGEFPPPPPVTPATPCTPGEMSVPHSAHDPCPQTGTACAMANMLAISTCGPDRKYSLVCACVPPSGS